MPLNDPDMPTMNALTKHPQYKIALIAKTEKMGARNSHLL